MKKYITIKISIDNENAIEWVIASLIGDGIKINKKTIVDRCKNMLAQNGVFFNDFPNEKFDTDIVEIWCDRDKEIKEIFNKYFK